MYPLENIDLKPVRETAVILLVEDREDDILLVQRALEKACVKNPLHSVLSGEDAVAYLEGAGKYCNRTEYPLPALIFLDLKLPGMDGFEVLTWIRRHDTFRALPVVVLTSSDRMSEVNKAYRLGANSFFIKEIDLRHTVELAHMMREYWLQPALTPESFRPQRNPTEWWDLPLPGSTAKNAPDQGKGA